MFAQLTPWVRRLILASSLGWLLSAVFPRALPFVAFSLTSLITRPWTLVTHVMAYGGFAHLTNAVLPLFWLGPRLEARLGGRRFIGFFFLTGAGGALVEGLLRPQILLVGGVAAATAVSVGAAYLRPHDWVTLFPLPVRLPNWVLALATTAISVLYAVAGNNVGTADAAYVGATVVGVGLLKWWGAKTVRAPTP